MMIPIIADRIHNPALAPVDSLYYNSKETRVASTLEGFF